jgi:hypothetical protein
MISPGLLVGADHCSRWSRRETGRHRSMCRRRRVGHADGASQAVGAVGAVTVRVLRIGEVLLVAVVSSMSLLTLDPLGGHDGCCRGTDSCDLLRPDLQ